MGLDDLKEVADVLTPPEWNPSKRLKFDLAIVFFLGVVGMGLLAHTLAACGYFGMLGYSGFAMASDMTAQQSQLTSIQANMMQNNIDRDRRQICAAQTAKNQPALTAWELELQRDINAFYGIPQIKGQPQVRSCDELLITGSTSG